MLIIDTNVLVRCVRGAAMRRLLELTRRGVTVATTETNASELWNVLALKLGMERTWVSRRVADLLLIIEPIGWDRYAYLAEDAQARLREEGKDDWPALAAATALEVGIWSDDVDFLGVGVPVWSTPNVHLAPPDRVT